MKKLFFIIPKVNKFLLIIFFIQLYSIYSVNAASGVDGCHIITPGGEHRNYHTPFTAGSGSPTEWITTSGFPGYAGYNENTASRCISDVGPACTVYLVGSTAASKTIVYTGVYAIMINCPIDDYIPLLFIFTIGITLIKFKKVVPL